jgi:capsular polysaccharide biosynthesis protein
LYSLKRREYQQHKGGASMHKYQKTTRYHSGAVRVTIDQDITTITRLSGNHPTKSVICTNAQSREVAHFILEGVSKKKELELKEAKVIPEPRHPPFHVYRVSSEWNAESIHMMAQGLLDIAAYVEANRERLEQEAQKDTDHGQEGSGNE